jgi:hypothetical protein
MAAMTGFLLDDDDRLYSAAGFIHDRCPSKNG